MEERKYYRVDKRDAAPGEELPAEGNYQQGFDEVGQKAEAILEKVRAATFTEKPARADSIFVTDDLACAESYWRTHDKRYLYEVDIDENAIKHRGDMNWVDAIGGEIKKAILTEPDEARCGELARKYWQGEMSEKPCREFLLDNVTAGNRLKGLSDLKGYAASQVTRHDWKSDESIEDLIGPHPGANDQNS
jgi:hypothetical protein